MKLPPRITTIALALAVASAAAFTIATAVRYESVDLYSGQVDETVQILGFRVRTTTTRNIVYDMRKAGTDRDWRIERSAWAGDSRLRRHHHYAGVRSAYTSLRGLLEAYEVEESEWGLPFTRLRCALSRYGPVAIIVDEADGRATIATMGVEDNISEILITIDAPVLIENSKRDRQ